MSEALASLAKVFSNVGGTGGATVPGWEKLLLGGATGMGEFGNIMAGLQKQRELSAVNNQMKMLMGMTPQQLGAKVAAATQPLSQGLVQNVGNAVQAQMGERGLAQAPGIFAATEEQALAPYEQNAQQMAMEALLRQWGMPAEYANISRGLLPGQTDVSPLFTAFLAAMNKGGGVNADISNLPLGPSDMSNWGTLSPSPAASSDYGTVAASSPLAVDF